MYRWLRWSLFLVGVGGGHFPSDYKKPQPSTYDLCKQPPPYRHVPKNVYLFVSSLTGMMMSTPEVILIIGQFYLNSKLFWEFETN